MVHLDILKELQKRRRRKVEINKSMHDNIKYHADMRVEHLLLEKDVQDMMLAIKAAQNQNSD